MVHGRFSDSLVCIYQVGLTNDERDSRHHYLKGLEGCSAGLLAGVQAAFEDLYGLLRALLDHTLGTGQVTPPPPLPLSSL